MPVYVQLITWTEKGVGAVKDTGRRAQQLQEQAGKMGIRFREIIWTMGRFDAVAIFDAPDDETASRLALWAGSQGAARTETTRGYTAEEIERIVKQL